MSKERISLHLTVHRTGFLELAWKTRKGDYIFFGRRDGKGELYTSKDKKFRFFSDERTAFIWKRIVAAGRLDSVDLFGEFPREHKDGGNLAVRHLVRQKPAWAEVLKS